MLCAGDVLRDMGLRDAFNVQLSVPALNGDAVTTVLRSLNCFNAGEVLQVGGCGLGRSGQSCHWVCCLCGVLAQRGHWDHNTAGLCLPEARCKLEPLELSAQQGLPSKSN